MIIEVASILFSVFALTRTYLRFREGKISPNMLLVWSAIWITIIAYLIFPGEFDRISKAIGIQRPLDFMMIAGLVTLYYLNFRLYVFIEEIRGDYSILVREFGINKEKKDK